MGRPQVRLVSLSSAAKTVSALRALTVVIMFSVKMVGSSV